VNWHQGMDRVDSEGYIYPTGAVRGGHCVIVDGVVFGVENEVDRFRIRNSWGLSWGLNGRCRIKVEDLRKLLSAGGTACMAVDIPAQDSR
jgi:C1A family cysteine protease